MALQTVGPSNTLLTNTCYSVTDLSVPFPKVNESNCCKLLEHLLWNSVTVNHSMLHTSHSVLPLLAVSHQFSGL